MTFSPNIPQSSDLISQSQAQFLTNFGQLNTIFDIDHVTYNNATVANRGKHNQSTYVEGSDPTTAVNEIAVYSKDTGTQPDLFYRPESSGTAQRLTGGGLTAAAWAFYVGNGTPSITANYNISGIALATTTYTISFTRSFANTNYAVIIQPMGNVSQSLNILEVARNVNNFQYQVLTNGVAGNGTATMSALFFGLLA